MRFWMGMVAAVTVAAPVAAQAQVAKTIRLETGETVTILVGGGGATVAARGPGTATALDRAVMQKASNGAAADATGSNSAEIKRDGMPAAAPIRPNAVKLTLLPVPGTEHRLLVIENGYAQAFTYRATVQSGDRSVATDVCQVIPVRRGYEHWPYRFDALTLSNIHLESLAPGAAVRCE